MLNHRNPDLAEIAWPAMVEWYDVTLPTPAENLALDEALLQELDANPVRAVLRTWHPTHHFVVVGRSNKIETEVSTAHCTADGVSVFRRTTGGGAVVLGPGCLAYALMLPLTDELRSGGVAIVTRQLMGTIASSLSTLVPGMTVCGTSDLVVNGRKISGNSQRWLKNAFLHHGTILYDFDLVQIERLLQSPSRQPDYRSGRSHSDFVANVAATRDDICHALVAACNGRPATCPFETLQQARQLAKSRYELDDWTYDR